MDKSNSYINNPNNPNNIAQQNYGNENTNNYPQSNYTGFGWGNSNVNNYTQSNYAGSGANTNTDSWGNSNNYNASRYNNQNSTVQEDESNSNNYSKYLDVTDPICAEVIYSKETTKASPFIYVIMIIIFLLFIFMMVGIILSDIMYGAFFEALKPISICLFLASIGLSFAFFPTVNDILLRRRCTHKLIAKIVHVEKTISRRGSGFKAGDYAVEFYPTYKYYFNGKIYITQAVTGDSVKISVGDEVEMFINKDEPTDIFVERKIQKLISFIVGMSIAIIPLAVFLAIK